jgi:SAM-dependent methyltransferase
VKNRYKEPDMNTFGERYSKLYDLLYKDKNYQEEFQYVLGVLEKHASNEVISILDIGCGTGKYLKLFKNRRIGGGVCL